MPPDGFPGESTSGFADGLGAWSGETRSCALLLCLFFRHELRSGLAHLQLVGGGNVPPQSQVVAAVFVHEGHADFGPGSLILRTEQVPIRFCHVFRPPYAVSLRLQWLAEISSSCGSSFRHSSCSESVRGFTSQRDGTVGVSGFTLGTLAAGSRRLPKTASLK